MFSGAGPRAAIGFANTPLPRTAIGKANTPLPRTAIGFANTPRYARTA